MTVTTSPSSPVTLRNLIYLIEDDEEVAQVVIRVLHEFEFLVEWFRDGASLMRRLQMERPDLCILDLGLPDGDGLNLIRQITAMSSCGVLILTGRHHAVDRVMALELGGDDYVLKPFDPRELVARIRSILRRSATSGRDRIHKAHRYASFLGWTLDCAGNSLRSPDGTEHLLSTAETQVLREFVERPHQILTREQLLGQRDLSPMDRSIDVRISRIRRKIEDDSQNPKIIKTVYGAGYMFTAQVTWS